MRTFWKIVYYGFAIHLSKSTVPFFGQFAKRLRRKCAKHLFAQCGADLNLEQGAYFGSGKDFWCLTMWDWVRILCATIVLLLLMTT